NRGVEKRDIFLDEQDYSVFLSYLQTYTTPKDETKFKKIISSKDSSPKEKDKAIKQLLLKNYSGNIELVCYAFLPNHFHLLIYQNESFLNRFMNSLGTRYGMYFNRKYKRTGILFQDVYKAVIVRSDEQLLHLSRYIHLNPTRALNLPANKWQDTSFPSSLPEYFGKRQTSWIKKEKILNYFSKTRQNNSYEKFLGTDADPLLVKDLAIDFEED
ncbi:transposase, partial [Candidatus Gottesmanbacteria bacterium]|nr:transposase [Candidatus Gottesmanbacteria bacterium]